MHSSNNHYHFIYKTTCKVSGKYYIGMHSTDNKEDGYLGSGKILNYSIAKHGKENHKREILEFCSDRKTLANMEKLIVNENIIKDPLCMNLKIGGIGGCEVGHVVSEETKKKISKANKGRIISTESRARYSKAKAGKLNPNLVAPRPIIINCIRYDSIISASKILGINDRTLCTRLKSKFNMDYQYVDSPKLVKVEKVHGKNRAIIIDGVEYVSRSQASKKLEIGGTTITKRCQSDTWPNYQYKD